MQVLRYKLIKDLPTFKKGEIFYISARGDLCAEKTQGFKELVVYKRETLDKFPTILGEWFVAILPPSTPSYPEHLDYDLWIISPKNQESTLSEIRACIHHALCVLDRRTRNED